MVYLPLYSTFAQRAYDSILHDIARPNLHVVFGIDRSGIVPNDGDTHQGIFDVSMFNAMPNMVVTMPKDLNEARKLIEFGFYKNQSPFVIRYPKGQTYDGIHCEDIDSVSWKLEEEGNELNIITYGPNVNRMIRLTINNNIKANIINARFIKPMDMTMLDKIVNNELPILIYEEVVESGSLGQSIINHISKTTFRKTKHMCINSIPEHGDIENLLREQRLDEASIIEEIKKLCV
jgi:1-deoxy-D-xylulose-5-phosphate synthase